MRSKVWGGFVELLLVFETVCYLLEKVAHNGAHRAGTATEN